MNLPSFKSIIPALTIAVIVLVLVLLPSMNSLFFAGANYSRCSEMAVSDPAKALPIARAWRMKKPGSPLARHCEAVALFGTKDYIHSAEAFFTLARETDAASNPSLAARLYAQSARAYTAAKQYDAAGTALTRALTLQPGNVEIKSLAADIAKEKQISAPAPAR